MKHTLFLFLLVSFFVKSVAQPKFYPSNFVSSNFWMCSEFRFGYEFPVSDKKHTIEPILFAAVPSVFGLIFNSIPSFSTGNFHSYFGGGGGMAYRYYFIKEKGVNPFIGTSLTASAYSTTSYVSNTYWTSPSSKINSESFKPVVLLTNINFIGGFTSANKRFSLCAEVGTGFNRGWADYKNYGRVEFPNKGYYSFLRLPFHAHVSLAISLAKRQKKAKAPPIRLEKN